MKESEKKCRQLVDNAPEAIVVVQDGRLVFCNPGFECLTGVSNSTSICRSLDEVIHPDDRPEFIKHYLRNKTEKEQAGPHLCRIEDTEGRASWTEINRVPKRVKPVLWN